MAKGKIKTLVVPWDDMIITRNGVPLIFTSCDLARGEGKYLGLASSKLTHTKLVDIVKFTAKNEETANDPLAESMFINDLADIYNSVVFRNAWRTSAEEIKETDNTKLTAEQKAKLLASFEEQVTRYFNKDTSREAIRDASYYRRKALEVQNKMTPLVKAANGKFSSLSAEQQLEFKTFKAEKEQYLNLAAEKELEELNALSESLDLDIEESNDGGPITEPVTKQATK